ncbi:unnamed protein product [Lepeophtheirus salmonis]|uniref:(salmon louse) hypothetical protein n=1 Tax=Lepeophtheirus salmonis TaxID=72036 RepID=A0A7R8CMC0_LEPSM|nr:unnamed protein product [Lepeophtheirus salmonis]CAF2820026.1 unnamed protein product [Lepeophtheirus salmonis]
MAKEKEVKVKEHLEILRRCEAVGAIIRILEPEEPVSKLCAGYARILLEYHNGLAKECHDIHLLETISKTKIAGLTFNQDKCNIMKCQVEYFGRIISPKGVSPWLIKGDAIRHLAPQTVKKEELHSFIARDVRGRILQIPLC